MTDLQNKLKVAKPEVGDNQVVAFLLASITGIGTIISAFGVSGSVIGRMVRDHPVLSATTYGCALLAVLAGVVGLYRPTEKKKFWFNSGLLLYGIAGAFAIWAAIAVWGDHTSPQISASAKPSSHGGAIDLAVKSSGLQNNQRITVDIWPIESTSASALSEASSGGGGRPQLSYSTGIEPLYQLVTGPDADGNVDLTTSAHLPVKHPPNVVVEASTGPTELNDCMVNEKTGCVFLDLGGPARPQISASVAHHKHGTTLHLKTYASGIAEQTLHFRVFAELPGHPAVVAAGNLAPDSEGELNQSTDIPIPRHARRICAVTSTSPMGSKEGVSGCPPKFAAPPAVIEECIKHTKSRSAPIVAQRTNGAENAKASASCAAGIRAGLRESTSWIKESVH